MSCNGNQICRTFSFDQTVVEQKLRKNLKVTKALLADAQLMLDKHKAGFGQKNAVKQLRNQVDVFLYIAVIFFFEVFSWL